MALDDRYVLDLRSPLERRLEEAERAMRQEFARAVWEDNPAQERVDALRRSMAMPIKTSSEPRGLDAWLPKETNGAPRNGGTP